MQKAFDLIVERLEKEEAITIDKEREKGIKDAIEIVNQVAEEYSHRNSDLVIDSSHRNDGWIPCSERLPSKEEYQKCNGQFIVSDGNRTYATYFDIYDTLKFGEPTIERFRVDKCVIAWQPLPQPYVKGE